MISPTRQYKKPLAASIQEESKTQNYGVQWLLVFTFLVFLLGNTPFKKLLYGALIIAYVILAISNIKTVLTLATASYSLLLLWGLLLASYFWAVVPAATADVIFSQSTFFIFVLCIAARYQWTEFAVSFRTASMALAGFVVIYFILFPGISLSGGSLKAFYIQKNLLGAMMALCSLSLFFTPDRSRLHIAFGILTTGLLIATQSKTSISLFVLCSILVFLADWWANNFYALPQRISMKAIIRSALFITVLMGLTSLVIFRNELLDILWAYLPKKALTGRGELWLAVIQQIRGNSLFGIGPGAFWQAGYASEITQTTLYQKDPYWVQHMVSADGGYIDLIASFGVLGLAVFFLTAVELYRRLFRNWYQADSRMIFILVTFVLIHAITESTILYSTNILWLIYLLCYFRVVGFAALQPKSSNT